MRTNPKFRTSLVSAVAALALATGACSNDSGEATPNPPAAEQPTQESGDTGTTDAGQGDYAFGTNRDQITEAIVTTYSSSNAKGRWDGNTFILSIEGDAEGVLAGFSECRVVAEMLQEDDSVIIEYPNGQVDCTELLGQ